MPSSRSELTEINIRQKPGFAGLFFFLSCPLQLTLGHTHTNPKIYSTTNVHLVGLRAHAECAPRNDRDHSTVTIRLLCPGLRVIVVEPVILRGAIYCTSVAMRSCEKRERKGCPDQTPPIKQRRFHFAVRRRVTLKNNSEKLRLANHLST